MTTRLPRQARAHRTRERLLTAGCAQFSRSGYAHTTASSIAEAAEVATGSFYQYFRNKDDLLEELAIRRLERHSERLRALLAPLPADGERSSMVRRRIEEVVAEVWEHHAADPAFHAIVTERRHADAAFDGRCAAFEADLVAVAAQFLADHGARCAPNGSGNPEAPAMAAVLFAMVEGAIHAEVLGSRPGEPGALRAALVEAVMRVAW